MGQARHNQGGLLEQFTVLGNEICVCFQGAFRHREPKSTLGSESQSTNSKSFLDRADHAKQVCRCRTLWIGSRRTRAFSGISREPIFARRRQTVGKRWNAPTASP